MSATPKVRRVTAVLKMPPRKPLVGTYVTSIINAMTGNTLLPSPTPPLATLSADLAAFEASEATALTRVKGAAVTRNEKYLVLHGDLEHEMAYVQSVADANPGNAQSIIESSGFAVRKTTSHPKTALKATVGTVPGAVKVVAKAVAPRASYEWQYSTHYPKRSDRQRRPGPRTPTPPWRAVPLRTAGPREFLPRRFARPVHRLRAAPEDRRRACQLPPAHPPH